MDRKTIERIRGAVDELKKSGTRTTIMSVAKHLGVSKQRVHSVLQKEGELSILDSFRKRDGIARIAGDLKGINTANLYPSDIKKLPVAGLADLTDSQFSLFLSKYEIPHVNNRWERILLIENTEKYSARELFEMVGGDGNWAGFREILYVHKIPFKNDRRNRAAVSVILRKLGEFDSSKYTARELYELMGSEGTIGGFYNILRWNKVPYRKMR